MIANDAEGFLREICFTESGPSQYARSAVLAPIPSSEFATAVATAGRHAQEKVAMALSIRYDLAHTDMELNTELSWLAEMVTELGALAAQMPPIPRHHLRSLFRHYVLKHVPRPAQDALSGGLAAKS
jgi:hypothetical protein